jgi:predicted MFS family arabinose efflux permease
LAIAALLSSISGIVLACAMDYFVKHAIASNERTRKLAFINTISQFMLIFGTGIGGYLVALAPWRDAFLVIGCCGIGLATLCACRLPALTYAPRTRQALYRAGAGPALYLKHHRLFAIASCSALAFAVGQVTNTLLPAFLSLDLKFSSEHCSSVEAAWSIGALAASAVLTKVAKDRLSPLHCDLFIVFVIAGLLFLVPRLSALTALLAVHLALGIGFAIVRVRTEARFITECPTHLLARFRANSLFLSSAVSAIVFIAPTIYRDAGVPALYQLLSAAIALSALVLFGFTRPWRAEPSSLSSR